MTVSCKINIDIAQRDGFHQMHTKPTNRIVVKAFYYK
jgi:hypothetical protein